MPISKGRKKPTIRNLLRKMFRKPPKPKTKVEAAVALFNTYFIPPEGYKRPPARRNTMLLPETEKVGRHSMPSNETDGAAAIFKGHVQKGGERQLFEVPMFRQIKIDRSKNYRGKMGRNDVMRQQKAIGGYNGGTA